jgi:polysaccharide pyruvyl transferase WcaK-like protein
MKKYNIAQIGTFDVENYGDLLFPVMLKHQLEKRMNNVRIDLFSPKGGIMPFTENTHVYPINEFEEACQKSKYDAIIIGGGDLIRLDSNISSDYQCNMEASLSVWQLPILIGKKYNARIIFNNPGVPFAFNNNFHSVIRKIMTDVDYISVRDKQSKSNLVDCGVSNVQINPDTILAIDEVWSKKELSANYKIISKKNKILTRKNYIIFQHNVPRINDTVYLEKISEFIDYINDKYEYDIVLLPIGYVHNDIAILSKIKSIIKNSDKIHLIEEKLSPYDMITIIANSKGFIGTSLHGIITASAYNVPILAINNDSLVKVHGYLQAIGKENIEVIDINKISSKFDKYFFTKYSNDINECRSKIDNHFSNIVDMIKKGPSTSKNSNPYNEVISLFYEELSKVEGRDNHLQMLNIYADYGNGFNEQDIIRVNYKETKSGINVTTSLPNMVKKIRIDLAEGRYIKVKNLVIKANKKEIWPIIPNSKDVGDEIFIFSDDPQIIINKSMPQNTVIDISLKMSSIDSRELCDIINKLIDNNPNNKKLLKNIINNVEKLVRKIKKG